MKRIVNIGLFCLLVLVSALVTFWLVNHFEPAPMTPEERLMSERLAAIPGETVEEKFQSILDRVTSEVRAKVSDYKQHRLILPQIANPVGLKSPEYIAENASVMKASAEKLREEIVAVMAVFDAADDDVKALVYGQDPEKSAEITAQWQKLEDTELVRYVDFFGYEDEIINTYELMMEFYAKNADTALFDEDAGVVGFSDPATEEAARLFRKRIEDLGAKQTQALSQG